MGSEEDNFVSSFRGEGEFYGSNNGEFERLKRMGDEKFGLKIRDLNSAIITSFPLSFLSKWLCSNQGHPSPSSIPSMLTYPLH